MLTRADYDRSTYAKATADKLPHGVAPLPSLAADSCSNLSHILELPTSALPFQSQAAPARPNVIIVMPDDPKRPKIHPLS